MSASAPELGYAALGATHQSLEDVAFLRLFPEMTIVCPADPPEARAALNAALAQDQPIYIRLGKKGEPLIHGDTPRFRLGQANWLREGRDLCLIGTGAGVKAALDAAEILRDRSVSAAVVEMHTLKPIDTAALTGIAGRFSIIATVEEHNRSGGLGGIVAEWIGDQHFERAPRLFRFGTQDKFLHEATSRSHAQHAHGMAPDQIADALMPTPTRSEH